ncbi:hypothetical protein Z957_11500 [Clostridium sp. K25]|uniref:PulJ/GspJ family protein n=1 Tax=Clostridium sp. K25 TaxID=1443109 RepID=UPI0004D59110|nr:hypothetical protein [Clostridium sp. K25]KEI06491.1 hypothetical protein Z957_11500 [Clostridium sp. K25]
MIIKKRGMTFLEILITMGIFFIFLLLAYPFFISNLRTDIKSEAVADLQIEGNKAKECLSRLCMEAYSIKYDKKHKVWEIRIPSNKEDEDGDKTQKDVIKIFINNNSMNICGKIIANYVKNINISVSGDKPREITITINLLKKVSGIDVTSQIKNIVYSRNMN